MGYISTTVDVDIDFDDISDDDIVEILEDRIKTYKRKIERGGSDKDLKSLKESVADLLDIPLEPDDKTLLDNMYDEVFKEIRDKFTLEQVTNFLKSRNG